MGERTGYVPGTFCWVDLATPDPEGAKRFYSELLGWESEDAPVGDGQTYTMLRVDGKSVGALYEQPQAQRDQGAPPAWSSYVSVEDANEAAKRAGELGGDVHMEPFDVMTAGRMAVIQDPQGAFFCVWQRGQSFGAELVNAPGALTLNQLNASDPEAARSFYEELFGWRFTTAGEGEAERPPYWGIYVGETLNAGMMPMPEGAPGPSHWLAYFATDELDGAAEGIPRVGGRVVVPPMEIPNGARILVAQDPQGAFFALYEGYLDP